MDPPPFWFLLGEAVANWLTAIGIVAGGAWAVYVFAIQRRKERKAERELRADTLAHEREDLKWRRALQAKKINDEMLVDSAAFAAMDFVDDDFEVLRRGSKSYEIGLEGLQRALAFDSDENTEAARAVRECFDSWFYYLNLIQHYIDRGLIESADVEYPSKYYIGLLRGSKEAWSACEQYLRDYDAGGKAVKYMEGFGATPRKARAVRR
jgi:hypothetical protein